MLSTEGDPVRLLVAHGGLDDDDYHRLIEYLGEADGFFYDNLTRPEAVRSATQMELQSSLTEAFGRAEVLVVLATTWLQAARRVELHITMARRQHIGVIALPASGTGTFPRGLENLVDSVVIWNERLIVDAILLHARGEQTNRFEVIDFP